MRVDLRPWFALVVLAACLVGHLQAIEEWAELSRNSSHEFSTRYRALEKSTNGLKTSICEKSIETLLHFLGVVYAFSQSEFHVEREVVESVKEIGKRYDAVFSGECVDSLAPKGNRTMLGEPGDCMSENEAQREILKHMRISFYLTDAIDGLTGVRTRLQWYRENDLQDIINLIKSDVKSVFNELLERLSMPIYNIWKQGLRLKKVAVARYSTGSGTARKLVEAADGVFRSVVEINAIIRSKGDFLASFYDRVMHLCLKYAIMYAGNLKDVVKLFPFHNCRDDPYSALDLYWESKATEYAVSSLFSLQSISLHAAGDVHNALESVYSNLVEGKTDGALRMAYKILSLFTDEFSTKLKHHYQREGNSMVTIINLLEKLGMKKVGAILPNNFEEIHILQVPTTRQEEDEMVKSNLIYNYLSGAEKESMLKLLLGRVTKIVNKSI